MRRRISVLVVGLLLALGMMAGTASASPPVSDEPLGAFSLTPTTCTLEMVAVSTSTASTSRLTRAACIRGPTRAVDRFKAHSMGPAMA